jgi:ribosomal protein L40E
MAQETEEELFVCPICEAENRQSARFCRRCGRSRVVLEREERGSEAASDKQNQLACSRCEAPVRVTDSYCSHCGESQPYRILAHMKVCRDCGTQMPEIANFCYACGADVGNNSAKQVPVPVALFDEDDPDSFPQFEA